MQSNIFWFRRDLRIEDNTALIQALNSSQSIIPIFVFDINIIKKLPKDDARISFIYNQLIGINKYLKRFNSSLLVLQGDPEKLILDLVQKKNISALYSNLDYEPYAIERDMKITNSLKKYNTQHLQFKDQVIFGPKEILKDDNNPYTVYTPYKNKWLTKFEKSLISVNTSLLNNNFSKEIFDFPDLKEIGFVDSKIKVSDYSLDILGSYKDFRDFPALDKTSYLSVHLRFGTVSIREIVKLIAGSDSVFLSELIWREFFMQILYNFPHVASNSFKTKYDKIVWRNNKDEFKLWCEGKTGYPIVDSGMRQLNETGYMHNRVRMIVAGFLCKHLLVDWRWGEKYFSQKLLDYEISSNNGNWQWAAGTGCDSAPYFRIFNPFTQQKKFDKDYSYVKKWIKDFDENNYLDYIVDHKFARKRALDCYKLYLS
ncbi:MAG: deoxyribodipyrimidine photo-lyase [Flavobacteriales bacterium]|nr:deoxyribodipyrimidine photo-lyase [Flavobacteriales bacterium]